MFLFLLEGFTRICFDVEEEEETRSELRGEVVGVKRWCHIFFYCTVLLCLRVRMDGNYSKRTQEGERWGPPCSETDTSRFPPPKEGEWVTLSTPVWSMDQSKKAQFFWKINSNAILDRFLFTHHGINDEDENIAIETVSSLRPKKKKK